MVDATSDPTRMLVPRQSGPRPDP